MVVIVFTMLAVAAEYVVIKSTIIDPLRGKTPEETANLIYAIVIVLTAILGFIGGGVAAIFAYLRTRKYIMDLQKT